MSLGTKILWSIFTISILIATTGITSNWYTNSILNELVQKNVETTNLVELTANIENELYQSLITLIGLKESKETDFPSITLEEPTEEMYLQTFDATITVIKTELAKLSNTIEGQSGYTNINLFKGIDELNRNFTFYEQLSIEWLEFRNENKSQSDKMFGTSLTPYFSNNIIPVISELRQEVIAQQIQENSTLDAQLSKASVFISSITFILLLISIGVALFLFKSIATPLKKLNKGAQALGAGNLEERVEIKSADEIGELANSFNTMASNLQKRTLARDYLDNIIESIHEVLIVTDELGTIVGVNNAAESLLGYSKSTLMSKPLSELLEGEQSLIQKKSPRSTLDTTIETKLIANTGKSIPVLFSESELVNSKEEFVGKVVVATDITERNRANARIRASLKEKEVLLAEIHHRVKNNLAVISGILQLQSRSANNKQVEEALTESQTRIKSISLVHEMLYQSETLANISYNEYVLDLIVSIAKLPLASDRAIKITAEAEDVELDLNVAVPCSMLLNEIIVDRLKHSFEETKEGNIHVILRNLESSVELSVEHNGKQGAQKYPQETLGFTLIKTLISQLHGTYYEEFLEERETHRIRIVFPIHSDLS